MLWQVLTELDGELVQVHINERISTCEITAQEHNNWVVSEPAFIS